MPKVAQNNRLSKSRNVKSRSTRATSQKSSILKERASLKNRGVRKPSTNRKRSSFPALKFGQMPSKIGRFEILEELGHGGMGVVYKAMDPESGNYVAVKTIRPERTTSQTARRQFLHEVDCVIQLDHPHIVKIIEDGDQHGFPYYVMEYNNGCSLDEYIAKGQGVGIEWILGAVYKISLALQYVHEKGLLHMDVKPSNILVNKDSEPFLSDFGIARQLNLEHEDEDEESETAGTPLYMSPEQVLAPSQVDQRADIYSLGILMYELLTGVRPFRGQGTEDVLTRVLFWDPIPPRMLDSTIPVAVETVVTKAMEKNTQKRYQTAIEFARDLKKTLVRVAMNRRLHKHETAVDFPAIKRN